MSGSIYTGTFLASPGARGGTASLTIDGEVFDVQGDTAYDTTTVTRETLLGQSGVQGFSEMPKSGYISAKLRDAGNLNVGAMKSKVNSTVVLRTANGKLIQGDQMWCTECSEVATQDATFSIKFEGYLLSENTL